MSDLVKRRNGGERGGIAQLAGLDPWRAMWSLLSSEPLREAERTLLGDQERAFMPRFDVKENRDSYVFQADLPGMKEENVEISVVGNRLTVTGRRELEEEQIGETFYARERVFGVFTRSFLLPDGTDGDQVKAELKDGVLTIVVPKKPEAQPRKIAVGKGNAAGS